MDDTELSNKNDNRLKSPNEIVELVKTRIFVDVDDNVDLTLISILLGFVEHRLTTIDGGGSTAVDDQFPVINLDDIIPLVDEFRRYILENVNVKTTTTSGFTDRRTIKDVASAILKRLAKPFRWDKSHCQTLFTFINGGHLDSFGLAFAVVAGCQVLGCEDVHLCLSEDHSWIGFGPDGSQMEEITLNGKQNDAHCFQPIENGRVIRSSWLYLGGNPVKCTSRPMEITAAVAMISDTIGGNDSNEALTRLKQDLMWMLYDAGLMDRYPMAFCVLAKLQEQYPIANRPDADKLFHRAIECSRSFYGDNHVTPHLEYGCYLHRRQLISSALLRWQEAANVLRRYAHDKEEEHMYKEVSNVANELIPASFKSIAESESFCNNTENLSNLLLFYDGVCEWEQNGKVPIFHNFWVKPFAQSVGHFPHDVRRSILASTTVPNEKSTLRFPAPLPRSPVKNPDAYHKYLLSTVFSVYGPARKDVETKEDEDSLKDFLRICETTNLRADLVSIAHQPITHSLPFRSGKMIALRPLLAKNSVRPSDVQLILCGEIESSTPSSDDGNKKRRSERKRARIE